MKAYRIAALVERDMRKFLRSPALMVASMIFPLVQLIVLGYAFGGRVRNVRVALVDEDRGSEALRVREGLAALRAGPRTLQLVDYPNLPAAVADLRQGRVRAIVHLPLDYSRRVRHGDRPRIVFIEDNTDRFLASELIDRLTRFTAELNGPVTPPSLPSAVSLDVVELYPYVEYIQYLLPGSIAMAIFVVAMIGGGITFIDDRARGLHEGYLVTPVERAELVLGLNLAGTIKGLMAGMVITVIGGLIAGIPELWEPVRLLYLALVCAVASLAMISLMFLTMVRVTDPLVPRAVFGVLNTLLFFPSGAIYPIEGFPAWLRWISVVDPFTYTVHALRTLLLKHSGLPAIGRDLLVLGGMSLVLLTASVALFRRQV